MAGGERDEERVEPGSARARAHPRTQKHWRRRRSSWAPRARSTPSFPPRRRTTPRGRCPPAAPVRTFRGFLPEGERIRLAARVPRSSPGGSRPPRGVPRRRQADAARAADALRAEGIWLVEGAPKDVCESFARHCEPDAVRRLSPGAVRAIPCADGTSPHPALDSRKKGSGSPGVRLSDVNPADPMGAADLEGVPLVPAWTARWDASRSWVQPMGNRNDDGERRPPSQASKAKRDRGPTYLIPHESEMELLRECAGDVLVDRAAAVRRRTLGRQRDG